MEPHNKLREIVWEITGRCENGCSYCGSKEVWKSEIDEDRIKHIATAISLYPPEELNISGGDPLLVPEETHRAITSLLRPLCKCKIIVNPKSFKRDYAGAFRILDLYDWVGWSINTPEELEISGNIFVHPSLKERATIVTNFSTQNIFQYSDIENIVTKHNLSWQIQYCVFKEEGHPDAIYNSTEAYEYLSKKITESIANKTKLIISDNMNTCSCYAGKYVLGITELGKVVPCLSMRSWLDINTEIQGDLLSDTGGLEQVWKDSFHAYRFHSFKCCKDHCRNMALVELIPRKKDVSTDVPGDRLEFIPFPKKIPFLPQHPPEPLTVYYGIWPNPPANWEYVVTAYATTTDKYTTCTSMPLTGDLSDEKK